MNFKFIDLFAGVGGFRYGIERAFSFRYGNTAQGNETSTTLDQSMEPIKESIQSKGNFSNTLSTGNTRQILDCVYSNEWDKYANSVYRKHFGACDIRDIRTVDSKDIPSHDLLVGGFPCQSFSVAGRRGGFTDTRGTLFFEIARIAQEKHPRLLLLENVKGLLSHDKGETFRVILRTLDELGYDVQWQVLNSKDFGVPQNRERVFIIGHLRGTSRPEVFPLTRENAETSLLNFSSSPPEKVSIATRHLGRNGKLVSTIFPTLQASEQPHVGSPTFIRRLTPIECERLQGFPDDWTATGASGESISDSQRYKMMGNAVTTNVVTAIMEKLL